MNVVSAVSNYVHKMIEDVQGMKVLVLDKETTGIMSMVMTQSEILAKETYYVEQLHTRVSGSSGAAEKAMDRGDDKMNHFKAIVFVRPTDKNLALIKQHLRQPKYKEYHLFFSNLIGDGTLSTLAELDRFDSVRQVKEFYADFFALNSDLFSLNLARSAPLYAPNWTAATSAIYDRNVEGLVSVLLSQKRRPLVRYQKSSRLGKKIAFDIQRLMSAEYDLFKFRDTAAEPVLLILDRKEDPVTPLLMQWTYQAMVHELLGVHDNRVDLSHVPGIRDEMKQIVLSTAQDEFYCKAKDLNFGDLGVKVKQLVQKFQQKRNVNSNISTIEDMTQFVENYPEFAAQSSHVSRHVSVISELSRLVGARDLMETSELEQGLAVDNNHQQHLDELLERLRGPRASRMTFDDKLRLVLLYGLRYETAKNDLPTLRAILRDHALDEKQRRRVRVVDNVLHWAGSKQRSGDLFGNKSFLARAKKSMTGLKGVDNIYTQHKPLMSGITDKLLTGKLSAVDFPCVDGGTQKTSAVPQDVIIFIVGGATYEEAALVSSINRDSPNVRLILGGSTIHNSQSFLDDVLQGSDTNIAVNDVDIDLR